MRRIGQISAMLVLAFFSYLMIRLTLQYRVMQGDVGFLHVKRHAYHIGYWRASFYTHVFTSCLVLIAGFTQFSSWLLRRRPVVHRIMGWIYLVIVIIISGPAAFVMALYANGGWMGRISFTLLAGIWWIVTFLAGYYVIRRQFARHGACMILSYALTLSAITLRAYTWLAHMTHLPINARDLYVLVAWLSWVPNLVVAIILIETSKRLSFRTSHLPQSGIPLAAQRSDV